MSPRHAFSRGPEKHYFFTNKVPGFRLEACRNDKIYIQRTCETRHLELAFEIKTFLRHALVYLAHFRKAAEKKIRNFRIKMSAPVFF